MKYFKAKMDSTRPGKSSEAALEADITSYGKANRLIFVVDDAFHIYEFESKAEVLYFEEFLKSIKEHFDAE